MTSLSTINRHQTNPASWAYERLAKQIIEFEKDLNDEEEIGARIVFRPEGTFHINDLGYWGPDFIIFYGENEHKKPIQLVQHYTQLNVLLTALPKLRASAKRVRFVLEEKLAKED